MKLIAINCSLKPNTFIGWKNAKPAELRKSKFCRFNFNLLSQGFSNFLVGENSKLLLKNSKGNFKNNLALLWKTKFFLLTTWFVATLFFPLLTKVADLPLKRIYEQFITQERHKAGQTTWEKYLARGLLTRNVIYCRFSSYMRISRYLGKYMQPSHKQSSMPKYLIKSTKINT